MKKVTLTSSATLKINVGNFESIDIHKTLISEIEYEDSKDVAEKSANADRMLASMIKTEAELLLKQWDRSRIMRINGHDTPVELWKSYVETSPLTQKSGS